MKVLLLIIGTIVLAVASSIWYGYVLSIIWGWFVAPTFNAPRLSIPVAIGLAATIGFITKPDKDSNDDNKTDAGKFAALCMASFGKAAMTLFFCWIVKHWM